MITRGRECDGEEDVIRVRRGKIVIFLYRYYKFNNIRITVYNIIIIIIVLVSHSRTYYYPK